MEERKHNWAFDLASIEFFYYFANAAYNYLTIFLKSQGYSVKEVSVLNIIFSVVAVCSTPLIGVLADKMRSSRKTMIIVLIGFSVSHILVPLSARVFAGATIIMLAFIILSKFFHGPAQSLMESTVIVACNNSGTDFGKIRLWGSISWVIMSMFLASFITADNVWVSFAVLGVFLLPCIYLFIKIKPIAGDSVKKKEKGTKLPFGKLFKNPYFISYIFLTIAVKIEQSCNSIYLPYLIEEVGGDMAFMGYIQAYNAIFQVPVLLFSSKIAQKMSLGNMCVFSTTLTGLMALLYGRANSFVGVLAFTTLSAIGSGFNIAGSFKYIFCLTPKELQSTGQTVIGACTSFAGIIGSILGTALVSSLGVKSFYTVCGVLILGIVAMYLTSFPFFAKVLNIPFVDYTKVESE